MDIGHKVAVGSAAIIVLVATGAGMAVAALRGSIVDRSEASLRSAQELAAAERLRYRAEHVVAASRGYLLTEDVRLLRRFELAHDQLIRDVEELGSAVPVAAVAALERSADEYTEAVRFAVEQRAQTHDPRELLALVDEELLALRGIFETQLHGLVHSARARSAEASARADAEARRAAAMVAWLAAAACIVVGLLAMVVIRALRTLRARAATASERATDADATREELLLVAHDLKNPLGALLLAAELAVRSAEADTRARGDGGRSDGGWSEGGWSGGGGGGGFEGRVERLQCGEGVVAQLQSIKRSAHRMQRLIEELLDAARIDAKKPIMLRCEPCRVDELIAESQLLFEAGARARGVRLSTHVATADGCTVDCDRDRLLRVLANLVGNALSVTPRGGEVALEAAAEDGALVALVVRDTGPGIAPELLPRIFDRHWQGERRASGLGLGLHIAKTLIELHAGTVRVESAPGGGCRFTVTLPMHRHATQAQPSAAGDEARASC